MVKFAKSIGVKVKELAKVQKKKVAAFGLTSALSLAVAVPSFAATPAVSTGNPDVDEMIAPFFSMFDVAKLGFKGLAIASVAITIIVVLFFWVRGKAKQSVQGA